MKPDELTIRRQQRCADRRMGHSWKDFKADILVCVDCGMTINQANVK